MRITSTKDQGKRYSRVEHDDDSRGLNIESARFSDGSIEVDIRFTMDDRRVYLRLTESEVKILLASLNQALTRVAKEHTF